MATENARLKLEEDLARFKEDCIQKGWEDDEVDERVAEAFENFAWYKHKREEKRTWLWNLWNFFLFSFIIYLAGGAYLAKNRRLRKNISDKIFDLQIQYQQVRLFRFLSLPFTKWVRLERLTTDSCLLSNPLFSKSKITCDFCTNNTAVQLQTAHESVDKMMNDGEIFTLHNVPGYANSSVRFGHVQELFLKHSKEMDDSICKIYYSELYNKMSDYFQLSEDDVSERKLSIGWKNCEGYGSRFYRELFTRPSFASSTSEIHLEKYFFLLQPEENFSFDSVGETEGFSYIFQAQGEATFSFFVPTECRDDCIEEPIDVTLNEGQIVVYPNAGWKFSAKTHGSKLSIIYLSSFVD